MLKYVAALLGLLLATSGAFSCEERELPVELLGKNTFRKEVDFGAFLEVVVIAPSPDADLLPRDDKIYTHRFVIDKERAFYSIGTIDGVVFDISTYDECLVTNEGVRVGDRFTDVLAAYSDSRFERKIPIYERSSFELDIVTKEAKLTFRFSPRSFKSALAEKNYEKWDSETKDALRVYSIIARVNDERTD